MACAVTDGTVTSLAAAFDPKDFDRNLDYQVNGEVHRITIDTVAGTMTPTDAPVYTDAGLYRREGTLVTWQNENGLYLGTVAGDGQYLSAPVTNEAPVFTKAGGSYYAYWACGNQLMVSYSDDYGKTWNPPAVLIAADGYLREISCDDYDSHTIHYLVETEGGSCLHQTKNYRKRITGLRITPTGVEAELYLASSGNGSVGIAWTLTNSAGEVLDNGTVTVKANATEILFFPLAGLPLAEELTLALEDDALSFVLEEAPAEAEDRLQLLDVSWREEVLYVSALLSSEDYRSGLAAEGYLTPTSPLTERIYTLSATLGDQTVTRLVGYGNPLAEGEEPELFVEQMAGERLTLSDKKDLLWAEALVYAAQYDKNGKMTAIRQGKLIAAGDNKWTVAFPQSVNGWTLFLLRPDTYVPLWEALS